MKTYCYLLLILLPFVLGAIVHFTDAWVYIPSLVVGGMFWAGAVIMIASKDEP